MISKVLLGVALVIVSYWTLDRRSPVQVHSTTLSPLAVRPGETMARRISVTRFRVCPTKVEPIIIDGARGRWVLEEPETESPGHIGSVDTYTVAMIIPVNASPGNAELRLTITRKCNPIQAYLWPLVTTRAPIKFTILPKEVK